RAANRRLVVTGGLSRDLSRSLKHIRSSFADVEDTEFPPSAVPQVSFTRLNAHWEAAFRLARLILQGETLRDETGASLGTAFTIDMNKLFEKFVEEIVDEQATRAGLELRAQRDVPLTDQIRMTPDLLLLRDGKPVAVGDAKYIELGEESPHANLYQL